MIAVPLSLCHDSVVCVLVQVDKDIRHPLLLEQPSLQAAISSWRSDFELQEIFRKGKTQPSPVFMLFSFATTVLSGVFCLNSVSHMMFSFWEPAQISNLGITVHLKCLNLAFVVKCS